MKRSGAAGSIVPASLTKHWSVDVGHKISAPTIAGGQVFVAESDAHRVFAFDASTGEPLWQYTAGGPVDSPPTVAGGRAIFGCRDGSVYCLDVNSGALCWRFRTRNAGQKVIAFGHLESQWPVHGSVLVRNNVVHFSAGRSTVLSGGIDMYGLDLQTGEVLSHRNVTSPDLSQPDIKVVAGSMPGAKSDILTSDGDYIYLKHLQFDPVFAAEMDVRDMNWGVKSENQLLTRPGFLDPTCFSKVSWSYGTEAEYSQMLVFDREEVYGMRYYWGVSWNSPIHNIGDDYYLFSRPVNYIPQEKERRRAISAKSHIPFETYKWSQAVPLRIRAMVLTGTSGRSDSGENMKRLFIAGPKEEIIQGDPFACYEGRTEGYLWVFSAEEGKLLSQYMLESPPVWDGMAAASGKLFIATMGGELVCLGGE
jgi:outer membrane protein assembly factor BamB